MSGWLAKARSTPSPERGRLAPGRGVGRPPRRCRDRPPLEQSRHQVPGHSAAAGPHHRAGRQRRRPALRRGAGALPISGGCSAPNTDQSRLWRGQSAGCRLQPRRPGANFVGGGGSVSSPLSQGRGVAAHLPDDKDRVSQAAYLWVSDQGGGRDQRRPGPTPPLPAPPHRYPPAPQPSGDPRLRRVLAGPRPSLPWASPRQHQACSKAPIPGMRPAKS